MTTQLGDQLLVVYGPPGTGKTTRMLELLETELAQLPPDEIALVTFTRAARLEARDRALDKFNLSEEELKWFRTLHSTAWQLLGMTGRRLFKNRQLREFCKRWHYDLSDDKKEEDGDELGQPPARTRDDDLRVVHEWGRHRMLTPRQSWSKGPKRLDWRIFELYLKRYSEFKEEHKLLDWCDMLEQGVDAGPPPVRVAIIDEAQDLTPLQIKVCYAWFSGCDRVYVAGDDDQAIYCWSGADPQWLIDLQGHCTHYEMLKKSYRVPERVQKVALNIIHRNRRRVDKPYKSFKAGGGVQLTTRRQAVELTAERATDDKWSTFVLVRNRVFAKRWTAEFLRAGVPYISEIGAVGPLGKSGLVKAVMSAAKLLRGKDIEGPELRAILDFVPARGVINLPRGTKTRARAFSGMVTRMQLILEWQLTELVERLEKLGPARGLFKEKRVHLDYLDLVLKRLGTLYKIPTVRIMTIHASKGREANTVIVDSDMAKASWREWRTDPEGENRVAYVAVTRAKDELLICDPQTPRHFPYWEYVEPEKEEKVPF